MYVYLKTALLFVSSYSSSFYSFRVEELVRCSRKMAFILFWRHTMWRVLCLVSRQPSGNFGGIGCGWCRL